MYYFQDQSICLQTPPMAYVQQPPMPCLQPRPMAYMQPPVPCVPYYQHLHFNYPGVRMGGLPPPPLPPVLPAWKMRLVGKKDEGKDEKNDEVEMTEEKVEEEGKSDGLDKEVLGNCELKSQTSNKSAGSGQLSGRGSCRSKIASVMELNDEGSKHSGKGAPSIQVASIKVASTRVSSVKELIDEGSKHSGKGAPSIKAPLTKAPSTKACSAKEQNDEASKHTRKSAPSNKSASTKPTSAKEPNGEGSKHSEKGATSTKAPSNKAPSTQIMAKRNPGIPPSLTNGKNYMFPSEHTRLHILNCALRIWEKKYEKNQFRFNIYKVGTHMTVNEVIQNTMNFKVGGNWEKCKGWAATEIIERGDGKWEKGTTIEYSSDKAKGSVASMGWTAKRGTTLPPVWITVHRF